MQPSTTPPQPTSALTLGAEVWCAVEGAMVRQDAAPSIGDLDRRINAVNPHPFGAIVEQACATRMPVLSSQDHEGCAALAWPVIDRDRVSAVVTLYLDKGAGAPLAAELWTGRPGRSELCLGGSHYQAIERFAKLSPHIAFPNGSGLPGRVWQTCQPQIEHDLSGSATFLRSSGARDEGLGFGFAMPCVEGSSLQAVALLLSGFDRPFARICETWMPDQRAGSLRLARKDGVYVGAPSVEKASKMLDVPAGDTWIGRAWATRKPEVICDSTGNSLSRHGAAEDGITSGIAIPIIVLDDVKAVAVLMW